MHADLIAIKAGLLHALAKIEEMERRELKPLSKKKQDHAREIEATVIKLKERLLKNKNKQQGGTA